MDRHTRLTKRVTRRGRNLVGHAIGATLEPGDADELVHPHSAIDHPQGVANLGAINGITSIDIGQWCENHE